MTQITDFKTTTILFLLSSSLSILGQSSRQPLLVTEAWLESQPPARIVPLTVLDTVVTLKDSRLPTLDLRRLRSFEEPSEARQFVHQIIEVQPEQPIVLRHSEDDRRVLAEAFWLLEWSGFRDVRVLVRNATAPGKFAVQPDSSAFHDEPASGRRPIVEGRFVQQALGREGYEILDIRSGWKGVSTGIVADAYVAPPRYIDGHIPDALPFSVSEIFTDRWPGPEEVRSKLAALGPRPNDNIRLDSAFVVYSEDRNDANLGLAYLAFRQAGLVIHVYRGGWRDWLERDGPVVRIVKSKEVYQLLAAENPRLALDQYPTRSMLIDLREQWDFGQGHLPGAYLLSAFDFQDRFDGVLAEVWPDVDRERIPLIFYCYGEHCVRSRRASTWSAQRGFKNLLWLREGMDGWVAADYPIVRAGDSNQQ